MLDTVHACSTDSILVCVKLTGMTALFGATTVFRRDDYILIINQKTP